MGTTAQKLQAILDSKSDIKDAIEAKGVTVGDAPFDEYASKIGEISGGAEEAPENDVNFYDYDGFRVASYTIAEAKALTALPTPPIHTGLTFQEWNWSLADIQGYNRRYINIGANYIPTDGKIHIHYNITEQATIELGLSSWGTGNTVVVDFGDGTTSTYSGTSYTQTKVVSKTYSSTGSYDMTLIGNVGGSFSITFRNLESRFFLISVNLNDQLKEINIQNSHCIVSVAKNTNAFKFSFNHSSIPNVVIPKNTTWAMAQTDALNLYNGRFCCPASVPAVSGTRFFYPCSTITVIPEIQSGTFAASAVTGNESCFILSLPLSLQWTAAPASNVWVVMRNVKILDIAQGWTPNHSISLSASTNYTTHSLVDFFTKLGTTSTAITLTFGATNLAKLTEEQKAIATNKGYTLA